MDVLRAQLARSWPEDGMHVEDDAAHRLVATTCSALGSLVEAHVAHYRRHGVRELVFMIQDFLAEPKALDIRALRDADAVNAEIESLRDTRHVDPTVLDALRALVAQVVTQDTAASPHRDDHDGDEQ